MTCIFGIGIRFSEFRAGKYNFHVYLGPIRLVTRSRLRLSVSISSWEIITTTFPSRGRNGDPIRFKRVKVTIESACSIDAIFSQPRFRPRYPLSTVDTYGAIYILPNILSSRKWPEARAKLLNIQRGNEAKFVCVGSRRRYTFGSSTVALLTESSKSIEFMHLRTIRLPKRRRRRRRNVTKFHF